ncbi:MAG: MlaD family protein [Deltaproteobacteria bacterium]|nr:MlaD family protein [Deltaproteobacteria bacterium]
MSDPDPGPPAPSTSTPLLLKPLAQESLDRKRAVRVGVVVVCSVLVLIAILLATGPIRVLSGPRLDVDFAFCGPIKPGASVRVAGVVVGVVDDVVLLAGKDASAGPGAMVRVRARVEQNVAHLLTTGTRFYVTTLGVLGEHYLDIDPEPGTPLVDGARVDGVTLARADLLLPRASALLERADALLPSSPEAKRLMTTTASLIEALDAVLKDEDQQQLLKDGLKDATALVDDLRVLVKGAAVGVGDGRALKRTLEGLPPLIEKTGRLEDGLLQAELHTFVTEARTILRRTEPMLLALEKGPAADPVLQTKLAVQLSSTLGSLDQAARRAERLLGTIEKKEGAAGKLFYDESVADDLKAVLKALREDPMKFLFR